MEDLLQVGHEVEIIKGVNGKMHMDRDPHFIGFKEIPSTSFGEERTKCVLIVAWFKTQRFVGIGILCMEHHLSPLSCQPMAGYFGGGHPTGGVQVQVQDTELEFPRSWGLKWWFYCIETRFGECICSRSGGCD